MGVVVRRYIQVDILTIIINFPYSTCISSFFGSSIPTSLFIVFSVFIIIVSGVVNTMVSFVILLVARTARIAWRTDRQTDRMKSTKVQTLGRI